MSVSDKEKDEIEKSSAPLIEHLIELRRRLIWSLGGFFVAFLVCFFFAKQLFNLLVIPFKWAIEWAGLDPHKVELIYTAPQEFFFTQIKLAMFGGMVIAFPLIATQIYKFIAPGLYKNERNAFLPFLIASPILFLMGASLVYFFFTPMVMWFFLAMQQAGTDDQVQISLLPKVSEYLSLIMTLIFSFGLVFQLPVVTSLMARVGMLSSQGAGRKAQMGDRHRLRRRRRADAAGSDEPDRPRHPDHPSLRGLDLGRADDRAQTRKSSGWRARSRTPADDRRPIETPRRSLRHRLLRKATSGSWRKTPVAARPHACIDQGCGLRPLAYEGRIRCLTSNGFARTRRPSSRRW